MITRDDIAALCPGYYTGTPQCGTPDDKECKRETHDSTTERDLGHAPVWHVSGGKWRAYINIDGKMKSLGYYNTVESAAMAYAEASAMYHGKFGRLG